MADRGRTDGDVDGPRRTGEIGGQPRGPVRRPHVLRDALPIDRTRRATVDGRGEEPVQGFALRPQVGEIGVRPDGGEFDRLLRVDEPDVLGERHGVGERVESLDVPLAGRPACRVEQVQRRVAGVDELWQHKAS